MDELNEHIRNLDDDIDRFMKQEDQDAALAIQEIPGIAANSAQVIISVIGNDMSRFPSDRNISKWAGLCPGNNESASKRRSGKTTKGNNMLRTTLVNCAHSAVKMKKSYLSAFYLRTGTWFYSKSAPGEAAAAGQPLCMAKADNEAWRAFCQGEIYPMSRVFDLAHGITLFHYESVESIMPPA